MKKIPSVFKRNYDGDRLMTDEVVPESSWVLAGEGVATLKIDGTCCMIRDGKLYKRYDRKVTRSAKRRGAPFGPEDCKDAPEGWEACEDAPNEHTGHWPGWLPVGDGPEDKYHREAMVGPHLSDGTYELIGPKIQGNPYGVDDGRHKLIPHGAVGVGEQLPRTFENIRDLLEVLGGEGIVYHHPDGRMAKVKRRDFGFPWPKERK